MKQTVKMLVCLSGDTVIQPGDLIEVPGPVAEAWILVGHAVAVPNEPEAEIEEATATPRAEKAVTRNRKKK
jgi:hypothetical protein